MRLLCLVLLALFTALPALAAEHTDSGWRFSLGLEAAWVSTNDRLDAYADAATLPLDEEKGIDSRLDLIPLLDVSYRLPSTATEFYLATPFRAPGLPLALGAAQPLSDGTIADLSIFSVLDAKTWQSPYLQNQDLILAHHWNAGTRLDLRGIRSTPWGATVTYRKEQVLKDTAAKYYPDLNRKGERTLMEGRYLFQTGRRTFVTPYAGYEWGDYLGSAESYNGWRAGAQVQHQENGFGLNLSAGVIRQKYGHTHPLFGQVRDQREYSLSGLWTWKKPLDIEPGYFQIHLAANIREANIDFFDAETFLFGTSIGARF